MTPVNWTPDNRRSVNADQMCDSWVFFLYFYLRIVYILQVFRCLRRIRAVVTLAKKGGWHTFLPPYRLYAQVQVVFISTSAVLSLHWSTSLHISHFQEQVKTHSAPGSHNSPLLKTWFIHKSCSISHDLRKSDKKSPPSGYLWQHYTLKTLWATNSFFTVCKISVYAQVFSLKRKTNSNLPSNYQLIGTRKVKMYIKIRLCTLVLIFNNFFIANPKTFLGWRIFGHSDTQATNISPNTSESDFRVFYFLI